MSYSGGNLINEFIGGNYRLLSSDDIYSIHQASLEILERTGIATRSQNIIRLMEEVGANVDRENKIIRIPEHIVKEFVSKAPPNVRLCGKIRDYDLRLEGCRVHPGTGGTAINV
ncbi:MAG TPA: hypothetical protein ENF42_02465, partial [Candidatus Bathyarchaeota archaeon]|nr:hypothetical protein [Candidatus Bathyarchaeota archaeon]